MLCDDGDCVAELARSTGKIASSSINQGMFSPVASREHWLPRLELQDAHSEWPFSLPHCTSRNFARSRLRQLLLFLLSVEMFWRPAVAIGSQKPNRRSTGRLSDAYWVWPLTAVTGAPSIPAQGSDKQALALPHLPKISRLFHQAKEELVRRCVYFMKINAPSQPRATVKLDGRPWKYCNKLCSQALLSPLSIKRWWIARGMGSNSKW